MAGGFTLSRRGRTMIVLAGVLVFDALAIASVFWYVHASRTAVEERRHAFEQSPPVLWRENVAQADRPSRGLQSGRGQSAAG